MKKPENYYGFAFSDCKDGYNKKYLKSKKGKKDIKKCKKRQKRLRKQLKKTGIDESETWSLDYTFSNYILPRLKIFKETKMGYPSNITEEEWNKILDKMIFSFEQTLVDYDGYKDNNKEEMKKYYKKVQKGFSLFGEYYMNLWS